MARNFKLGLKLPAGALRDPRVMMRALIAALLAANLAMAVVAFKPFGGSAEDLRREQASLEAQLAQLKTNLATRRKMVDKVQTARSQGDQFLTKYFLDARTASSEIDDELLKDAKEAGLRQLPATYEHDAIEGSDTMEMLSVTAGLEGTYESLTKFINLLDKSPRFLIVDGMQTAAPQQNGKNLSVQIKIHTFTRAGSPVPAATPGAEAAS